MANERWLSDLAKGLTIDMLPELQLLASHIDRVALLDGQSDNIRWRFSQDGDYSAKLTYQLQFSRSIPMEAVSFIW